MQHDRHLLATLSWRLPFRLTAPLEEVKRAARISQDADCKGSAYIQGLLAASLLQQVRQLRDGVIEVQGVLQVGLDDHRGDAVGGDVLEQSHLPPVERVESLALTLRSEEHTSELQSLMRISYAVFCL